MPATGWTNAELMRTRCYYVALFPGAMILLISLLSIIPIIVVAVLYSIILIRVLKIVNDIKSTLKVDSANKETQLRMYRGTVSDQKLVSYSKQNLNESVVIEMKSIPLINAKNNQENFKTTEFESIETKSNDFSINDKANTSQNYYGREKYQDHKAELESDISVYTIESNNSDRAASVPDVKTNNDDVEGNVNKISSTVRKVKEPNKWRAISIVMLTSGSFVITWMPFFIAVMFFVFCEEKLTNPKCLHIRSLLGGPLATLGFFNSILNPLIYAWWHKGFQRSIRMYYRKCIQNICVNRNCNTMKV